jgi:predicted ferric reductase
MHLGFATAMIALGYHQPRSAFYAIIALSIFILDRLLRLFKLNYVQAHLTPFPASSSIMITIPTLRSGWRAGQHVFLTIPSLRTSGGMNWVESHPFTIASASDGQEGVVLIVKKAGDWTRGLYDFAQAGEGSMGGNALEEGKEGMQMIAYNAGGQNGPSPGRACRIIVDGPYVSIPFSCRNKFLPMHD